MNARFAVPLPVLGPVALGITLMLVGDFMFALNDAMGKWLVASFSVGQVLLIRSLGAFLILGPLIARQGTAKLLKAERPGLQLLRAFFATADTGLFYAAVVNMPLADVMTFYMAGPIYVAALSHVFLGERVGWRRWLAILVGFAGVVVALRPSSASLSLPSLFAVLGSLSFAMTLVLARVLRRTSDAVLVGWQTLAALLAGAAFSVTTWITPSAFELGALLLLGLVSCAAHLMMTRSVKLAPASLLAPLQYTLLLWAAVFGLVFFGNWPTPQVLVGAVIIIVAGLFIFHRQNVVDDGVPPKTLPRTLH
ncbi:DMT family transporter [Aurantimonas sp. VKM B-3413]|uniref:DMT family transporter n=1 Tax=Aurantimonas sp. VKM B-3413 TaxID=2779401 RepID=UPI001E53E41B|nr:DMT family transporter [Aurantimonas sp. VKM B-3413]MCB8836902.1 DMT family transporter [Aurantimonas sp. VKM B-3413]